MDFWWRWGRQCQLFLMSLKNFATPRTALVIIIDLNYIINGVLYILMYKSCWLMTFRVH